MKLHLHKILLTEGFPTVSQPQPNFPKKFSFDLIEFS
jgi:hypothetical protein